MKKMMPALLALSLAFTACHKEAVQETTKPVPQKPGRVPVQFSAADFIQQYENLPGARRGPISARDSLRDKISFITYQALKDYVAVSTIHQDSLTSSSAFGLIRDTLPPGNYIFRILAYTKPLCFDSSNRSLRAFGHYIDKYNYLEPIGDIFCISMAYAVSPDSPAVVHPLKLERVVGKVVLNITDADALYIRNYDIEAAVYPTWQFYYWDGGTSHPEAPYNPTLNEYPFYSYVPRTAAGTFEAFLFPTDSPSYQISILVRNLQTGEVVQTRKIPGVAIAANRKTVIKGSLFGPAAWELQLKDEWDDDIDMEF